MPQETVQPRLDAPDINLLADRVASLIDEVVAFRADLDPVALVHLIGAALRVAAVDNLIGADFGDLAGRLWMVRS